jgi:hypothetical protein
MFLSKQIGSAENNACTCTIIYLLLVLRIRFRDPGWVINEDPDPE